MLQCCVILDRPSGAVSHFTAVAKGELEDRFQPETWPPHAREMVRRYFQRNNATPSRFRVEMWGGSAVLIAEGDKP